jgi:trehalose/maltose hydrolase-like predicted phosphorylase
VGKMLGQDVPEEWSNISQKMLIPFDEEKQYHPEYEGYNLNIKVKQADTILIGYPLMYDMDRKVRTATIR